MSQTVNTVKRLRRAGMSQAAIASSAGISQPTVAKWEAGKVPKAADAAVKLQQLDRDMAAAALASDSGKNHPQTPANQALVAINSEVSGAIHA